MGNSTVFFIILDLLYFQYYYLLENEEKHIHFDFTFDSCVKGISIFIHIFTILLIIHTSLAKLEHQ